MMNEAYCSPEASDEDLVMCICEGNQAALALLVERHHAALMGYLCRFTGGDRTFAEDITQETFFKVLRACNSFNPHQRFKPWLYAIATNLMRDHSRRLETRQTEAWSNDLDELQQGGSSPENIVIHQEEQAQVAQAMMQLSETNRATLILRFYNDLSLQEIAQALGVPLGTVKSRLSNAIHQLNQIMRRQC